MIKSSVCWAVVLGSVSSKQSQEALFRYSTDCVKGDTGSTADTQKGMKWRNRLPTCPLVHSASNSLRTVASLKWHYFRSSVTLGCFVPLFWTFTLGPITLMASTASSLWLYSNWFLRVYVCGGTVPESSTLSWPPVHSALPFARWAGWRSQRRSWPRARAAWPWTTASSSSPTARLRAATTWGPGERWAERWARHRNRWDIWYGFACKTMTHPSMQNNDNF